MKTHFLEEELPTVPFIFDFFSEPMLPKEAALGTMGSEDETRWTTYPESVGIITP